MKLPADAAAPLLVVIPSVPAARDGDRLLLDNKAFVGWEEYARNWPGRTRFLFPPGAPDAMIFGRSHAVDALPGEALIGNGGGDIDDAVIADAAVVLAAGDNFNYFGLAAQGRRLGVPICYSIEYTIETRLRIVALSDLPWHRKLRSAAWNLLRERERRSAFRTAAGLQANGVAAADAYRGMAGSLLQYFDTRLHRAMLASDDDLATKSRHVGPLRLAFTGRLERLKGAHHLLPVARALVASGVDFRLDIYGSGSLATAIDAALADDSEMGARLRDRVTRHAPIDFATGLVPWLRNSVDLFLCCHLQGDPSCTYLETLGCGVPILGYDNEAWRGIQATADVGWSARLGKYREMAAMVARLAADRPGIARKARDARDFAAGHCFEDVFARRIAHLRSVAGFPVDGAPA